MGSETNFFVAIPYNGRAELTSYIRDRKIRRLRTGELSTHRERRTHRETVAIESQKAGSLQRQKSQHVNQQSK